MNKCINFREFMEFLFDDEKQVQKGSAIVSALLESQSPRLSNIAEKMDGQSASCYKIIQRFLSQVDLKQTLLRFYQQEAEFVIGDPTEMERYKAPKTGCVGKLSDGKIQGITYSCSRCLFEGERSFFGLSPIHPALSGNKSVLAIRNTFGVLKPSNIYSVSDPWFWIGSSAMKN
jgi:hypothetical protein